MKEPVPPHGNKLAVAALAGSILLASLGISVTTVALPTLAFAFSASVQQVQWVVLAYLVSLTVAIVSAGRMGDLYGHRRVLLSGLLLFALATIACAMALASARMEDTIKTHKKRPGAASIPSRDVPWGRIRA